MDQPDAGRPRKVAYLLSQAGIGQGEPALQLKVLRTLLDLLTEEQPAPWVIGLITEGVTLATADSPVLVALKAIEARGTRIVLCKTCVEHYGIAGSVRVGVVGGMGDILAALTLADRAITL